MEPKQSYSRKISESISEKQCDFCNYINENNIIKESKYFALIPNRFPYVKNHIMLIPKRHIHSELDMLKPESIDFNDFHKKILKIFYNNFNSCFYFTRENTPDQSMWHFHRHYLPDDSILKKAKIKRVTFNGISIQGL